MKGKDRGVGRRKEREGEEGRMKGSIHSDSIAYRGYGISPLTVLHI